MKLRLKVPKVSVNKPSFSKESLKNLNYKKTFSGKFVLVILGLAILVVNYLSFNYFVRLDATDSQLFSLSPATKSILSEMSDSVAIEVYFSDNTPPNLLEPKQNVLDLLEEFAKSSNGKVTLDIKDPSSSEFETTATTRGIRQIQYSEYQDDKFSVAQGFLGIAFVKEDEVEAIPVISTLDNLEYEAVSRIVKLTEDRDVVIGFLSVTPQPTDEESELLLQNESSSYTEVRGLLERQYITEDVSFANGEPLDPEKAPVLVIISPEAALSERDLFEIEQFMFKGGRVLILEDLLQLSASSPILTKSESNLNEFLENYGLEVETKVLLDESFTPITSQATRIAYPFWILVGGQGINSEMPPFTGLESLTFPWANPIKKDEKSDLTYTELLKTTEFGWVEEGEFVNIDFQEFSPTNQKTYTLGYLVEGKAKTRFEDGKIPSLEGDDNRDNDDEILKETDNLKLVVVGDADFVSDNFFGVNEQNPVMFLNLVEWLANADDLSSVRSKVITTRPLSAVDSETKTIYKSVNSALVPVLIALSGFTYLRSRKNRKSSI